MQIQPFSLDYPPPDVVVFWNSSGSDSGDTEEKSKYHRSQTLGYRNGYRIPNRPSVGIGGEPVPYDGLSEQELDELANFQPTLTYGQAKQAPPSDFVPAHVFWDKKVLRFYGWYKQTVHESPDEHYRVRHVTFFYYLEDDSIAVVEPHVENSGLPQGKLIKRQRLPKNDVGDHWHWKDINIGFNITIYGKVFHLYNADKFTKEFLESEGIEVNPPEGYPLDPYIENRKNKSALQTYKTQSDFDKLRQFLEMDRKVLRFFVVWDDRDNMFGELRKFVLHYYLVDDTLEVRECYQPNDGRDPFPVLISRQRCPKNREDVDPSFPRITMELTENEIKEYFSPKDLKIGNTIHLLGRKFLLYDCDNFTKAFFWKNFGYTDFTPIDVSQPRASLPIKEVGSYGGYGSLADSLQSCLSLVPQPPRKDFVKMLENDGKTLRYEAVLVSNKPEDKGRKFIISYRLSDDMIVIYEPPVRNSGIIGGKFLERTRVAKPRSSPQRPEFYGPEDFVIGAHIEIFKHRFRIVNADLFVLNFMKANSSHFSPESIQALEQTFATVGPADMSCAETRRLPGELAQLVGEIIGQIRKIAITASSRKDHMFLGINVDRNGCITRENLRALCEKLHLPADDDIVEALACAIGNDPDHITLEEMRAFFEK